MQYSARSQFSLGAKLAEIRKDGAEEIGYMEMANVWAGVGMTIS